ncbi:MAG: hypothetical protein IJ874_02290 [Ruminococcus sp.]|nr:hypothetical protein [Ruminococcus sp.]
MKRISTFLPSLLLSVVLTLVILGGSLLVVSDINITGGKAVEIVRENNVGDKIYSELEKHWKSRYYTTGVPAEVYLDAVSPEWLEELAEDGIYQGFGMLDGTNLSSEISVTIPSILNAYGLKRNQELEDSISGFFSSYADENGIEKDEAYEDSVNRAISSAFNVINSNVDVYKFTALKEHGVIKKAAKAYGLLFKGMLAAGAAALVLVLLLMLVNRKSVFTVLYWFGISCIVSGVLGAAPCVYLLASDYFSSFSIKQAQIYTAYTASMSSFTAAFMATMIAVTVVGIAMVILYGVIWSIKKQKDKAAPLPEEKVN